MTEKYSMTELRQMVDEGRKEDYLRARAEIIGMEIKFKLGELNDIESLLNNLMDRDWEDSGALNEKEKDIIRLWERERLKIFGQFCDIDFGRKKAREISPYHEVGLVSDETTEIFLRTLNNVAEYRENNNLKISLTRSDYDTLPPKDKIK